MITQQEHLARILELTAPLPVEEVPLADALGHTLASNVTSGMDLPPWDAAAMDGYAVGLEGFTIGTLPVTKSIPAGHTTPERMQPGEAAAVMTGAPVPAAADTIVPLEVVHEPGRHVPDAI